MLREGQILRALAVRGFNAASEAYVVLWLRLRVDVNGLVMVEGRE
jgi:hypothetical protein